MSKSTKINRHPVLQDNIIYTAVRELNHRFKTRIDPEQFFDSVTSKFCNAFLEEEVLSLSFPVVATREYAFVHFHMLDDNSKIESIKFNNAFEKEIKRINE